MTGWDHPRGMDTSEVIRHLSGIRDRGAGGDGERRAAVWLRDTLRADGNRVDYETIWVRPNWPLTHALHAAFAVGAGILSVYDPALGLVVLVATLLSALGDISGLFFLVRRLTPRRATQNLVVGRPRPGSEEPVASAGAAPGRVTLLLSANIDAGRSGAIYRGGWGRSPARARRLLRGHAISALGTLTGAIGLLVAVAVARLAGASGSLLGLAQFLPTLFLLTALAALIDVALSEASPGANLNASGVATALAVFRALSEPSRAPEHLDVRVLLAGAGDGSALGIRAFVAGRRGLPAWRESRVVVIAFECSGAGEPCYLTHEGELWSRPLHPRLVAAAAVAADPARGIGARAHRGGGAPAVRCARRAGWPALGVGALDTHGRQSRAHQATDTAEHIDERALTSTLALTLAIVSGLDTSLAGEVPPPEPSRDGGATRSGRVTGQWRL